MSYQVIMSSKKANHDPGLCPVKGQKSGVCTQTGAEVNSQACLWVLPRPCQMLVIHPAFYLSYILPRDPQGWPRSNKLLNVTIYCELSNFISSYPSMPKEPIQPHNMLGGDIIQCLLALLYQWKRCSGGLECFQSCLAVRANTHQLLWSTIRLNFISAGQDSIYHSLKNCSIPS